MAEKQLIEARARAAKSKAQVLATVDELKHRLKPATLASDAWHGIKDTGTDYADKGVTAVRGRPAVAGSAVAAVALFLLRSPIAHLLTRIFGGDREAGRVTTDLSKSADDYDLTAPVVGNLKGVTK